MLQSRMINEFAKDQELHVKSAHAADGRQCNKTKHDNISKKKKRHKNNTATSKTKKIIVFECMIGV